MTGPLVLYFPFSICDMKSSIAGKVFFALVQTGQELGDIKDIKPMLDLPADPWRVACAIILCLLIIVLPWLAWYLWKRMGNRIVPPKLVSPRDMALEELKRARVLAQPETMQKFSVAISNAVRNYIEHQFGMHAAHQTTEEFILNELRKSNSPLLPFAEELKAFLTSCDLVKFARASLLPIEMEEMMESAVLFVTKSAAPPPPPLPRKVRS